MEKSYLHDGHEDRNEYNNMRDTAAWGSIILCPKGDIKNSSFNPNRKKVTTRTE